MTKGTCIMSITGETFDVSDQANEPMLDSDLKPLINPDTKKPYTWWDMRPTMIYIPYFGYAPLKKYIIIECKKNDCGGQVESWDRTLNHVDEIVLKKGD